MYVWVHVFTSPTWNATSSPCYHLHGLGIRVSTLWGDMWTNHISPYALLLGHPCWPRLTYALRHLQRHLVAHLPRCTQCSHLDCPSQLLLKRIATPTFNDMLGSGDPLTKCPSHLSIPYIQGYLDLPPKGTVLFSRQLRSGGGPRDSFGVCVVIMGHPKGPMTFARDLWGYVA